MKKTFLVVILLASLFFHMAPITYGADSLDVGGGQEFRLTNDEATGCNISLNGVSAPSFGCLSQIIINVIKLAIEFLGVVTIIFFLFGAFKFVTSGGDSKALDSGRNTMIYALLGAVFVVCSFLIVSVISGTFTFLPIDITNFSLYQN